MINVNQMTSQLARMPDQALQQYAQMHKNDPYIMALAMSESNRRKSMRSGAQMNAPEEPKVVDQAIQGMASPMPESVGIGQLPAGEMNFAGGGIVAFSDGGDVPRYQSGGMLDSARARAQAAQQKLYTYGLRQRQQDPTGFETAQQEMATAQAALQAAEQKYQAEMSTTGAGRAAFGAPTVGGPMADPAAQALPRNMPPVMPSAAETQMAMNAGAFKPPPPAAPVASAGNKRPSAPPPTGIELLSGPGAEPPGPGQTTPGLASTPSTLQREFDMFAPQGKVNDPFEADVLAQGQADEQVARNYAAKRKEQLEGMGLLGLEQEKRLKAREGKLGKQEGDLGPMALLQAGFAMMSGASPNALQNIGIGAQAGLKKYSEGIERLGDAREKIDDAFGRLDVARRSEKMLTDKEVSDLERDADKVVSQTRRDVLNSARTAYGLKNAEAGKLFDAYTAEKRLSAELGSREKISREQIQAQKDMAGQRNKLMQDLYGGDAKARQEYGKLHQTVMKEMSSNPTYTMEQDPAKKQTMFNQALQRALQGNPFLAPFASGIGFTKTPSAGKVYDLTGAE